MIKKSIVTARRNNEDRPVRQPNLPQGYSPALSRRCSPGYLSTSDVASADGQMSTDSSNCLPSLLVMLNQRRLTPLPREHLYRQHLESERCPRCYHPFSDADELTQHQRLNPPCLVVEGRPPTCGINKRQLELLKKKKRGGTEAEKCRRLYTILWPEFSEEDLPCPCKCPTPYFGTVLPVFPGSAAYGTIPDWGTPGLDPPREPTASEYNELLQQLPHSLRQRLDAAFPADRPVSRSEVVVAVEETFREL